MMTVLHEEADLIYAALSQSAGLAAAEGLALKYGRFVYLERLGFPDEYDAEACERAASEIAKEWLTAALAAVGAEPGPSDKPEPWWELLPAPTCPDCGGDTCDREQRIEEDDHAATE
jgi:hypothetical protein